MLTYNFGKSSIHSLLQQEYVCLGNMRVFRGIVYRVSEVQDRSMLCGCDFPGQVTDFELPPADFYAGVIPIPQVLISPCDRSCLTLFSGGRSFVSTRTGGNGLWNGEAKGVSLGISEGIGYHNLTCLNCCRIGTVPARELGQLATSCRTASP